MSKFIADACVICRHLQSHSTNCLNLWLMFVV